ncbi:MAG TPA: hypothetical protein VFI96_06295 [Longimicrobiaceae bacterium]|nr:hypothetical protein [Longimicrobiaceae bacterium]
MAWWNDYDRGYYGDRGYGYNRNAGDYVGYYGRQPHGAYGNAGYGGYSGMGYGYDYRTAPRNSDTYGRQGDQAARRWARREGYDTGYTIRPHRGWMGGGMGGSYDWGYTGQGYRGYDRGWRW